METPNPGSDTALDQGCLCPVLDNHHGQGFDKSGFFYINGDCPLHNPPPVTSEPDWRRIND